METIAQSNPVVAQSTKIFNSIFLYIKEDVYIKFSKVFLFPDSQDCYVGHIKIWDNEAPFYFVFKNSDLYSLNLRPYKNSRFIPNMFQFKTDKKGKNYLSCTMNNPNTELRYYPITSEKEKDVVDILVINGADIHIGLSEDGTKGEAFQIVKLS